jgi:glycerol-3-phosphate dehydrogenase
MWTKGWRDRIWSILDQTWDLIVIGGGITGAGILKEATRAGLKTLLVEARDFASGTSSRSSKLVHGGFRYLKNAQLKLTYDSVRERERLLREGRGLINQLGFVIACNRSDRIPSWIFGFGLIFYDLLAARWSHRYYDETKILDLCPQLKMRGLNGGYRYIDAVTDDARLVLRIIREAVADGGTAINYADVESFLVDRSQQVQGVVLRDADPEGNGRCAEVKACMVVNATGAWADELFSNLKRELSAESSRIGPPRRYTRLRKLWGSHLVFPWKRIPVTRAISVLHPIDHRPVFTFPWEGVTIIGTTDVDHGQDIKAEPGISEAETEYLLKAIRHTFPEQDLGLEDLRSTFSGIRAVIDTNKKDPSKESREHILWYENGMLTITGGKLTTFRLMAVTTLRYLKKKCSIDFEFDADRPILDTPDPMTLADSGIENPVRVRLLGRFGREASTFIEVSRSEELDSIELTPTLWAEIRWAARNEGVIHLDDLLFRRTRLGLTLPEGGLPWMEEIKAIAQPELGWDDVRWGQEFQDYLDRYASNYSARL